MTMPPTPSDMDRMEDEAVITPEEGPGPTMDHRNEEDEAGNKEAAEEEEEEDTVAIPQPNPPPSKRLRPSSTPEKGICCAAGEKSRCQCFNMVCMHMLVILVLQMHLGSGGGGGGGQDCHPGASIAKATATQQHP